MKVEPKVLRVIGFVYRSYKPQGVLTEGVFCWRPKKLCRKLIGFLSYEGIDAKKEYITVGNQGHWVVRTEDDLVIDVCAEAVGSDRPMWAYGKHPLEDK